MPDHSISATARTASIVRPSGRQYPTSANEYTRLAQLGEGSFGKVDLMKVQRTGELVAVKKVPLEDAGNEGSMEEALEEIALLMRHNSPHLVKMLASFVSRSTLWIVMEYLAGNSCHALAKARVFSEAEVAAVCRSLVEALDYVHVHAEQIHRDLKGANVLLAGNGRVCLGDFGVGVQLSPYLSQRHTQTGTPFWMAPEVIAEQGYDGRADIWSLGITAIELAKGAPPHSDFNPLQIITLIPKAAPPVLNKPADVSRFSATFRDFVAQCLTKNPSKRPTAAQLRLHPFIQQAGLDTEVLPPVIAHYRAWKAHQEDTNAMSHASDVSASTTSVTQGFDWSWSTHLPMDTPAAEELALTEMEGDEEPLLLDESFAEAQEELDQALVTLSLGRPSANSDGKGTVGPTCPAGHAPGPRGHAFHPRDGKMLHAPGKKDDASSVIESQDLINLLLPVLLKQQQTSEERGGGKRDSQASVALQRIRSGLVLLAEADPALAYDLIVGMGTTLPEYVHFWKCAK